MPPEEDRGGFAAMDQVGQWVRYADAKAGLVAAAFAGVVAVVAGQADDITDAAQRGGWWAASCITLSVLTAATTLITLWFLVDALVPRPRNSTPVHNRFSWPGLASMSNAELAEHVASTSVESDAWDQAKELADIAKHKYEAARAALVGFLFMTAFGVAAVVVAGVAAGLRAPA